MPFWTCSFVSINWCSIPCICWTRSCCCRLLGHIRFSCRIWGHQGSRHAMVRSLARIGSNPWEICLPVSSRGKNNFSRCWTDKCAQGLGSWSLLLFHVVWWGGLGGDRGGGWSRTRTGVAFFLDTRCNGLGRSGWDFWCFTIDGWLERRERGLFLALHWWNILIGADTLLCWHSTQTKWGQDWAENHHDRNWRLI